MNRRTTAYICVEGESEETFIKHVRAQFGRGQTFTRIESCHGGDPDTLALQAIKAQHSAEFHLKAVWFDSDKSLSKDLESELARLDFQIIRSSQCLENELLLLLNCNIGFEQEKSKKIKKYFQITYLNKRTKLAINDCVKLFPKQFLTENAGRSATIQRLIDFITNRQ